VKEQGTCTYTHTIYVNSHEGWETGGAPPAGGAHPRCAAEGGLLLHNQPQPYLWKWQ